MNDTVIKGTGDSRTLKGPPNLLAMYPTWQDAGQALQDGTFPVDLGPLNPLGVLQLGTGYTKGEVLPADLQTALSLPDNATPADAYKALYRSIYGSDEVIYRWLRTRPKYVEKQTDAGSYPNLLAIPNNDLSSKITIQRADSISVDPLTGQVSLNNPVQESHSVNLWNDGYESYVTGRYFKVNGNSTIYKGGNNAYITYTNGIPRYLTASGTVYTVTAAPSTTDFFTEIVTSTDPNAYPVAGDGWTYTELTPVPTMQPCARTQSGSYVGTGTFGEANPNSLTFEFEPKLLVIVGIRGYPTTTTYRSIAVISSLGMGFGSTDLQYNQGVSMYAIFSSASGKTISFSSYTAAFQQNSNGVTYFYTAIG